MPGSLKPNPSFNVRERDTLRALAATLLPEGGAIPYSHLDVDYLSFAQRYVADTPPQVRWLMKTTLWTLERLSWLWCQPWPRRFAKLAPHQRARVVNAWRTSRLPALRSALQVVSLLIVVPYYQDPRVVRTLGVSPGKAPGPLRDAA